MGFEFCDREPVVFSVQKAENLGAGLPFACGKRNFINFKRLVKLLSTIGQVLEFDLS